MQLKSLGNLSSATEIIKKNSNNFDIISNSVKKLQKEYVATALSSSVLSDEQKIQILISKGLTVEEAKQAIALNTLSASEITTTATTSGLSTAFKGLAASLGISTTALGTLVAGVTAISVATIAINKYKQYLEEIRQATEEAANAYKESSSSIDDYVAKYTELREALIKAKSNEEETYNIKKQLLDLQTELNEKFGDEYGQLNLVTDAYKDQTNILKTYNQEMAKTYLNENQKGIKNATKEMTVERQYTLGDASNLDSNDKWLFVRDVALEYKDKGIDIVPSNYDGSLSIQLTANAAYAYEIINEFESDLREKAKELGDEHLFDGIIDISSSELNRAKETINNYGDIYKQALMANMVSDDSKSEVYNKALNAVEEYNEAVLKSEDPFDDEKVKNARQNLKKIQDEISSDDSWQKYGAIIEEVFEQADTKSLDFNEKLQNDSELQKLADGLKDLDNTDLKSLNPGENASFDKLKESAEEYGLNVDELIDSLVRLGYVQGEIQNSTLADETFDSITSSISSSIQQIATQLEPQFAKLDEAYKSIFTSDGFTLDDVDNSMLEDLRQSFAELEGEVGIAFDATRLNTFFDALTSDYATSEEGARKVQDAFNDLATAYFYSTETLEQLNAETADAIEKQLEEMGVTNASEVIYDTLNSKMEALALQKQFAADTGHELIDATADEVASFLSHAGATNLARAYLFQLITAEQIFNNQDLNPKEKIEKLKELAAQYGQTAIAARIANMEIGAEKGHTSINYENELASLQNEINGAINNIQLDFGSVGGGAGKAGGAGKSAGAAYVDAFENELEELQQLKDDGIITEKEYLENLRILNEKYFKDKLGYEKEFSKYQRQYLEGYKSLYESALSGISKLLSRQIDGYNDAKDAAVSSLTEEKESRLEVIDTQKEQLEAEKSLIDEQINQKQEIIDQIQDEIQKMKDANDERKRQLDLQKAQYELERMQHQRTMLVNHMPDTIVI